MQRRTFLTTGSLAAIGFGLGGCATNSKPNLAAKRPMLNRFADDWKRECGLSRVSTSAVIPELT
jgi:hypothetical protein